MIPVPHFCSRVVVSVSGTTGRTVGMRRIVRCGHVSVVDRNLPTPCVAPANCVCRAYSWVNFFPAHRKQSSRPTCPRSRRPALPSPSAFPPPDQLFFHFPLLLSQHVLAADDPGNSPTCWDMLVLSQHVLSTNENDSSPALFSNRRHFTHNGGRLSTCVSAVGRSMRSRGAATSRS